MDSERTTSVEQLKVRCSRQEAVVDRGKVYLCKAVPLRRHSTANEGSMVGGTSIGIAIPNASAIASRDRFVTGGEVVTEDSPA